MTEPFWYSEPSILFSQDTWYKFVPQPSMPVRASLNAVVRFSVYLSVLLLLTSRDAWYLLLVPVVMTATVLLESVFPEAKTILGEGFASGPVVSGYTGTETSMPTADNPFMNGLFTDYVDNPERVSAPPDVTSAALDSSIREAFSKTSDLFMDTSDTYGLMESSRNWVTQAATTIPNDLDGFQKFLNKDNVSRKGKSEEYVVANGSTNTPIPVH